MDHDETRVCPTCGALCDFHRDPAEDVAPGVIERCEGYFCDCGWSDMRTWTEPGSTILSAGKREGVWRDMWADFDAAMDGLTGQP
jgi:hypothetical protein